jgi:hypothetical protein
MMNSQCFEQCDFIVLAINRQDPNPKMPFEAWAYRGPLNFQKATPVTFGQGVGIADALKALGNLLVKPGNSMNAERSTVLLQEQSSGIPKRTIWVTLLSEAGKLWMQPEGYGDKTSEKDCGYPISLEIWEGRLRLIVFGNIHREDPQIMDLERARESCRDDADECLEPRGNGQGITITPPPRESGSLHLYRVIYVIDVNATDAHAAAQETHAIMSDPNSWPPVLDMVDSSGHLVRIDLCNPDKPQAVVAEKLSPRLWQCQRCRRSAKVSCDDLAIVGTPLCSDCDCEMELL